MASFGDAILFLCVFGLASLPSSAATMWWLKDYRWFWFGLVALAATLLITLCSVLFLFGSMT